MECILKLEGYKDKIVNFQSFPLKGDVISINRESEFEVSHIKHIIDTNQSETIEKPEDKLDKINIGKIFNTETHIFCRKLKSI